MVTAKVLNFEIGTENYKIQIVMPRSQATKDHQGVNSDAITLGSLLGHTTVSDAAGREGKALSSQQDKIV